MLELNLVNVSKERLPTKSCLFGKLSKIFKSLKERKTVSVSLVFVSRLEMRRLNMVWRKRDKPTTILTFCDLKEGIKLPLKAKDKYVHLGDIFLCPSEIRKRSKLNKETYLSFLDKLLIHGVLHLYGYAHGNTKSALNMENKEKQILKHLAG